VRTVPDGERQFSIRVTPDELSRAAGTPSLPRGRWLWLVSFIPILALRFVEPMTAVVIGLAVLGVLLNWVAHVLQRILHDTSTINALKQKEHDLW
jgi:hypothetical protein